MSPAAGYNPIMDVKAQLARAVPKAPTIDEDALKRAYAQSPIAAEPDTFCLVRVIGNDLPPRHRVGQARQNVRFTLENEADFPNCTKHWVINRILVPEEQAALIELIESFGQSYEVVPFDLDAYARTPWDFEAFDQPIATDAKVLRELGGDRADTALDQLYRHKNCYVMNNNGARNTALRAGQKRAKWALPWDGNCFVTPAGWRQISDTIRAKPYLPYFIVPMARVLDNQALLQDDFVPNAVEEPQVAFRRDAPDRFDERYRYGRRPKVEFLWRIGVPGPWDTWRNNSWDAPFPSLCERAGQFAGAGWVARLFSGESHLEAAEKASAKSRAVARQTAISEFIDALDARVLEARTSAAALLSLDEGRLDRQRRTGQPDAALRALLEAADGIDAREASAAQRIFVLALSARLHGRSQDAAKAQEMLCTALAEDEAGSLLTEGEVCWLTDAVRLLQPGEDIRERFSDVLAHWLDRQTERLRAEPFDITRELDILSAAHFGGDWRLVAASLRRLTERAYHGGCRLEPPAGNAVDAAKQLQRWVNAAYAAERLGCDLWNERDASGNGLEHALRSLLATAWAETAPDAQPLRRAFADAYPCFEPEPPSQHHESGSAWPEPQSGIRPFWMLG